MNTLEHEPAFVAALTEIDQAHDNLVSLSRQLVGAEKAGDWSAVISDDRSGRLPSMIVAGVLGEVSGEELAVFGIEGRSFDTRQRFETAADIAKQVMGNEGLVVTDFVATGTALLNIGMALDIKGLEGVDVAAVSVFESYRNNFDPESWYGDLYIGSTKSPRGTVEFPFIAMGGPETKEAFLRDYMGIDPVPITSEDSLIGLPVEDWRSALVDAAVAAEVERILEKVV